MKCSGGAGVKPSEPMPGGCRAPHLGIIRTSHSQFTAKQLIRNLSTALLTLSASARTTKTTMTCVTSPNQRVALADVTSKPADQTIPKQRSPGELKSLASLIAPNDSYKPPPMRKRVIHELSPQRKVQIIEYILNTLVFDHVVAAGGPKGRCLPGLEYKGNYRPPTISHLEQHFRVSKTTLSRIWRDRHKIVQLKGGKRRSYGKCKRATSPKLEKDLSVPVASNAVNSNQGHLRMIQSRQPFWLLQYKLKRYDADEFQCPC